MSQPKPFKVTTDIITSFYVDTSRHEPVTKSFTKIRFAVDTVVVTVRDGVVLTVHLSGPRVLKSGEFGVDNASDLLTMSWRRGPDWLDPYLDVAHAQSVGSAS